MKKILFTIIALAAVILTTSCNTKNEKTLYEHGIDVIEKMDILAESPEWQKSATAEFGAKLAEIGNGDYTSPSAVYELKFKEDVLFMQAEIAYASDKVKEILSPRLPMTFISQINARGGAETLATSAMCTAGKSFVYNGFEENTMYIYCFENGISAAVSFTKGEDSSVSASGNFILNNETFPAGDTAAINELLKENFGENNYSLDIIAGK